MQAAGSSAKLVLLMRELDEAAMASLYATADVFVSTRDRRAVFHRVATRWAVLQHPTRMLY